LSEEGAEKPADGSGLRKEPAGPKPIPIKKGGHPHGTEAQKVEAPKGGETQGPPAPPPSKP
jgi:hypothetical protein